MSIHWIDTAAQFKVIESFYSRIAFTKNEICTKKGAILIQSPKHFNWWDNKTTKKLAVSGIESCIDYNKVKPINEKAYQIYFRYKLWKALKKLNMASLSYRCYGTLDYNLGICRHANGKVVEIEDALRGDM